MSKLIELKGVPHTLTKKDGSTIRIFPRKSVEISEEQISPEIKRAIKCGELRLVKSSVSEPKAQVKATVKKPSKKEVSNIEGGKQ